jgi:hypothetical protein
MAKFDQEPAVSAGFLFLNHVTAEQDSRILAFALRNAAAGANIACNKNVHRDFFPIYFRLAGSRGGPFLSPRMC